MTVNPYPSYITLNLDVYIMTLGQDKSLRTKSQKTLTVYLIHKRYLLAVILTGLLD